jgi:hypothetical protein
MNTSNTVSVGKILWKILTNPLASDLTYDTAAEFTMEALRILGAPVLYEDKFAEIVISEHKGKMPDDMLYIRGVRDLETDTAFREATYIYHKSETGGVSQEFTYEIQKGVIFTSISEGCVEVAYKGLMKDTDGYPLIVDNEKLKLALEYYILHRYLEPLWMLGKITDKSFEYIQQKRHFYMAAASNNLQLPSMDKMESIMNGINRIILNDSAHADMFRKYGEKEKIKRYR